MLLLSTEDLTDFINIELLDADKDGMKVKVEVGNEDVITCYLGEFVAGNAPLTIKTKGEGVAIICVYLEDESEFLFIFVIVSAPPDSAESEEFYISDKIFGIKGKVSYEKEGSIYNYKFIGDIINITSEKIEIGETTLFFYAQNGLTIGWYYIHVEDLEPGMSKPIAYDMITFYQIYDANIKNTKKAIRGKMEPGTVLPDGTVIPDWTVNS